MDEEHGEWTGLKSLSSKTYSCGHCGNLISSEKGYATRISQHMPTILGTIYICHVCNCPSYFAGGSAQVPGARLGGIINHLPPDIASLYKEIQNSTTVGGYTSAVLASRKLLMHVAVESGAEPGKQFVAYINYLVENGYTPPNSTAWIDKIRVVGNEANHEIVIMQEIDARNIIKLIEMLLKFNYEFPKEAESETESSG